MTALDIEKEKRDFEAWVRADIGMPSALPFNWEAEWVKTALPVWLAAKRANAEVVKVLQRALNAALDQPSSTTPAVTGEVGQTVDLRAIHEAVRSLECDPRESASVKFGFRAGVHSAAAVVSKFTRVPAVSCGGDGLLAEALTVFDLLLSGCREQKFRDYENGNGETIGPRMDALHAKLRAAVKAAGQGGEDARDGWVSVKDRLPQEGEFVLISIRTEYVNAPAHQSVSAGVYRSGQWLSGGGPVYTPTHWQPMPAPPAIAAKGSQEP